MDSDVRGRVENTPLSQSKGLLPVFEAIVNSVQSIEDRKRQDGEIRVVISREALEALPLTDIKIYPKIIGFDIIDNGIGFTDDNYKSFTTADSRYKQARGGKGVGRFIWLKTFNKIHISSTFQKSGKVWKRSFIFELTPEGVGNHELDKSAENTIQTKVSLINLINKYEDSVPKNAETIARKIVEHFLELYILNKMPKIILEDIDGTISLKKTYDEMVSESKKVVVKIRNNNLDVIHFLLTGRPGLGHSLNYCADSRKVIEVDLGKKIPNLPSPQKLGGQAYAGYVSGAILDRHVNQARTAFDFDLDDGSWGEIETAIVRVAAEYLEPYTRPFKEEKEAEIESYIHDCAPQYRMILKHRKDDLDAIPYGSNGEKLETALYEIYRKAESDLNNKARNILRNAEDEAGQDGEDLGLSEFLEEWNEVGKANLAKYIVHRKTVLTLLKSSLEKRESGKYFLEEVIHKLIFPMRTTSDDIDFEQQNLWILDEKLAYHSYLASDLQLKQLDATGSDDADRPDLIIFNRPIATVQNGTPFSSIVIFEFKRPMRNNYKDDDNPIEQVYDYVRKIRAGGTIDHKGRPIRVPESLPFSCYIICDLTQSLLVQAENAGFHQSPDLEGFYGFNPKLKTYVEIIGFDKLVRDAMCRNSVLFDKLGIPKTDKEIRLLTGKKADAVVEVEAVLVGISNGEEGSI